MSTYSQTNDSKMPPPPSHGMEAALKSASYEESIARLRDKMVKDIARKEKTLARAHYAVGRIILADPALWAEIAPRIDPRLDELGSGRKAVDEYGWTSAELEKLKKLIP